MLMFFTLLGNEFSVRVNKFSSANTNAVLSKFSNLETSSPAYFI